MASTIQVGLPYPLMTGLLRSMDFSPAEAILTNRGKAGKANSPFGVIQDLASERAREDLCSQLNGALSELKDSIGTSLDRLDGQIDNAELKVLRCEREAHSASRALSELEPIGPQDFKRQVFDAAWREIIGATRLVLGATPRVSTDALSSLAEWLFVSGYLEMNHSLIALVENFGATKLCAKVIRALLLQSQLGGDIEGQFDPKLAAAFLQDEEYQRTLSKPKSRLRAAGEILSWEDAEQLFILASCSTQEEVNQVVEAIDIGRARFEEALGRLGVANLEKDKALAAAKETANRKAAQLTSARRELETLRDLKTEEEANRDRIVQRIKDLIELNLSRLHDGYTEDMFKKTYNTYGSHLFGMIFVEDFDLELAFRDFDAFEVLAEGLLVAQYQEEKPFARVCASCLVISCTCPEVDELDKLTSHLERWHKLTPDFFQDLLDEFGDWTWGLFDKRPHQRLQYLEDCFFADIVKFDLLVWRLRLGAVAKLVFGSESYEQGLDKQNLPPSWKLIGSIVTRNKGRELPEERCLALIQEADAHSNPMTYVEENWFESAKRYQKELNTQRLSGY